MRAKIWARRFVLGMAAPLLAAGRDARAEDPNLVRSFPDQNFEWRVPSTDWAWDMLTQQERVALNVARVRREVSSHQEIVAWVRLDETKAFVLDSMVEKIKKSKEATFMPGADSEVKTVSWGGTTGSLLTIRGRDGDGTALVAMTWSAIVAGRFYRLDVHAYSGAERSVGDEIEALVAGFKFLKIPAPTDPAAPAADEGVSRAFPAFDLTWRLPKAAKARWSFTDAGKAELAATDKGLLASVEMLAPDGSQPVDVDLSVQPMPEGKLLEDAVETARRAHPLIDSLAAPAPVAITPAVPVGNHHGAMLAVAGVAKDAAAKSPKKPLEVRTYLAVLKGVVYQVDAYLREGAGKAFEEEVKAILAGLTWREVFDGVPGPMVWPFPVGTEPRGDYLAKDLDIKITKAHGFTLTKPAGWGLWKIDGAEPKFQFFRHQTWWFAAETRKAGAYCDVAVITYSVRDLIAQKPPKQETSFIDELEVAWKAKFPDAVTRPRSKELNRADGAFGEGKGWTYDFKGSLGGFPYLERGWVVRYPQYAYWIRAQYGGKDAEATFADAFKNLSKGFVYEK